MLDCEYYYKVRSLLLVYLIDHSILCTVTLDFYFEVSKMNTYILKF